MTHPTQRVRLVGMVGALLAALLVALAPSGSSAQAKNFRLTWPLPSGDPGKRPDVYGPFTHWDLREMPDCQVPWTRSTQPTADLDSNLIADEAADQTIAQNVFSAGFGRWDAVAPSKLGFTNIFIGIPAGLLVEDGWNTVGFEDMSNDPDVNGATMVFRSASTGRIREADIVLNSTTVASPGFGIRHWVSRSDGAVLYADRDSLNDGTFPNGPGDHDWNHNGVMDYEVDVQKTATHEIGHFIGIAHLEPLHGASNDPANPIMEQNNNFPLGPKGGGWTNITLKDQDRDAENFLYCPDLGDAPDPWGLFDGLYPSKVHKHATGRTLNATVLDGIQPGAEHIFGIKERQSARNWTYEWLAVDALVGNVSSECEANLIDADPFDDGVTWSPNPPVWNRDLTVYEWCRYASDNASHGHVYTAVHPLCANAWMDIDQNCQWSEGTEHFLHESHQDTPPSGANNIKLKVLSDSIHLPLPPDRSRAVWLRCRLDFAENSVAPGIDGSLNLSAGAAQFGEVEDYPFYCTTRYETMFLCNPMPFPMRGIALAIVGQSDPSDQKQSAVVTSSDCVQSINPAPNEVYLLTTDETSDDFPVPPYLPPFTYVHIGRCRLSGSLTPPQTTVRAHFTNDAVPAGTPAALVPPDLRIPTVNCAYRVFGTGEPNNGKVLVTVGAVDAKTGGWIDGPDSLTHTFSDVLHVTVAYRVAPNVIPLANLSPCDPLYNQYPLHSAGSGTVTPERAFEFMLNTPGDVPAGSHVILEVQTTWSTNVTVNHQIVEFPDPIGAATAVRNTPPRALALENYPNPFNPTTTIRFALPSAAQVTLAVYDVSGGLVRTLVHNVKKPMGIFEVSWDGTNSAGNPVPSGVYFYRLTAGAETLTRKAVLLK